MEKMSPEKAVSILQQHGTIVNIEEAKLILEFLHRLAILSIEIYLKREEKTDKLSDEMFSDY